MCPFTPTSDSFGVPTSPHSSAPASRSSSPEVRPARTPVPQPFYPGRVRMSLYSQRCSGSPTSSTRSGSSWSSPRERLSGRYERPVDFLNAAGASPQWSSVLPTLISRILDGECFYLPAPSCGDWRSPSKLRPSRSNSSGIARLPDVLGARVTSELCEWLCRLPIGWTDPDVECATEDLESRG